MKHLTVCVLLFLPFSLSAQLNNIVLEDKPIPKPTSQDASVAAWNNTQTAFTTLSNEEKDFYYWTNYSRQNPHRFWDSVIVPILNTFPNLNSSYTQSLKTDLYQQAQLPLLKLNTNLLQTAKAHAVDIGSHEGTPGHVSTDGRTFAQRIKAVGIKNCGGENVSLGDVDPILSLVLLYIDYGLPTLGHRKALLNPAYVETGVGVSYYGSSKTLFIVEDFSCSQQ